MADLIPTVFTTDDLRANELEPIYFGDTTLDLMGINAAGVDAMLSCMGLPNVAAILAENIAAATEYLKSATFYWAITLATASEEGNLAEINDGHVATKFNASKSKTSTERYRPMFRRAIRALFLALSLEPPEPAVLTIVVSKPTPKLTGCNVENTL